MAPRMNAPLYTTEILRLAASIPDAQLERVDCSAEERSPTCGSIIRTQVQLSEDGTLVAVCQQVQACAFGQASAALLALGARGRGFDDVTATVMDLSGWLAGQRADPGTWPGLEALEPARPRSGRHGAILLPFKALLKALQDRRE